MVFFSCDGCAEMLKKNQVDTHARRCRNCASVSCVDCSVSFWGDDYRGHTSCITEAERYEKSVYKGPKKNQTSNRKLTPQEVWITILEESLENCPPNLTRYIQQIISYENVPRKEKAFRNFASNSLKLYGRDGEATIVSLWKHFSAIRQKRVEAKEASLKENISIEQENDTKEKSQKSTNLDREQNEEASNISPDETNKAKYTPSTKLDKKAVSKAIKKALKKSPKHKLKMKELRQIISADDLFKSTKHEKDEWKEVIKDAILSKKNLKLEGKSVLLIADN